MPQAVNMTGENILQNSGDTAVPAAGENSDSEHSDYEPQFAPIVSLPEVEHVTLEEDETVVLRLRAKLFRFDRTGEVSEWKERGLGEVKMLRHEANKTVRIVMRRDKTFKVCANHFITPMMELTKKPGGHDKVLVYMTLADFSYEEVQSECFAIKFATVDYAEQFMTTFRDSQQFVQNECKLYNGEGGPSEDEEGLNFEYEDSDDNDDDDQISEGVVDQLADKLQTLDVEKAAPEEAAAATSETKSH